MQNLLGGHAIPFTAVFSGLLAILLVILACYVSWLRFTKKVGMGDGGNRDIERAIRAHGNSVEQCVPFFPLIFIFEILGGADWALWLLGGSFVVARFGYAYGLIGKSLMVRQITSAISYLSVLLLGIAIIYMAL